MLKRNHLQIECGKLVVEKKKATTLVSVLRSLTTISLSDDTSR